MNFDLNDPLEDIFSDNSNDNDSFFEHQPGRNKTSKNHLTKKSAGKGRMEDLFGIKEESEPEFKSGPMRASLTGGIKKEKQQKTSTPKDHVKVDESDDILSELGFDPKKPKSTLTAKSNLFDDILSSAEMKKAIVVPSPKTDQLSVRRDDTSSIKGTISRQSTDTTDNSGFLTQPRPKTSTGRRSSVASPANNNLLDLFNATPKEQEESRIPTPKVRKRGTTADWLGLGTESEEDPQKLESMKTSETEPQISEIMKIPETTDNPTQSMIKPPTDGVASVCIPTPNALDFLMTTSNLGAQNASQLINQQESHMALAMQMKNQEVALLEMQRRQHDLLSKQEMRFNDLLQKQLTRQNRLEESIKAQQERINAHIQLLMSQPPAVTYPPADDFSINEQNQSVQGKLTDIIELEGDVKRLELEKLRLKDSISNINANYEKEINMIEKSFKKQVEVLEDHLASVEVRLQGEIDALHKFYAAKLKSADEDKQEIKTRLESNLVALKDAHEEEIRRLKKSQIDDLESLREDHRRMLETVRQSKLLEFAVVQDNNSYLEILQMASNNLETVTGDLQTLRSGMERKLDTLHHERELKLEAREKKIDDAERKLKLCEEASDEEKRRLFDLVSSLESQLMQLSKSSSEENWILRQKMASLEAERTIFEKEKSLAREQISKDEKRVEELKEHQLAETHRQMLLIQEERNQLNVEKAKQETVKKLEAKTDIERSRQEIEACLKVAQDATRQAELERERFFKLQRQLETQKRELIEKEHMIRAREDELEQDVALAQANERKANDATQKARSAEQSFNEKIIFLQQKMRDLSEKESRMSQERLILSQERIEIQNLKSKLEQNKCSLCRIGERSGELSHVLRPNDGINGIPVIDDHNSIMKNSNAVDRFLDANIAESLERIMENTNRQWNELEKSTTDTIRPNTNVESNSERTKFDPTGDYFRNL